MYIYYIYIYVYIYIYIYVYLLNYNDYINVQIISILFIITHSI